MKIELINARTATLLEDITIESVTVRAGFAFDGATVPRAFWWLLPPFAYSARAACVHDWIYAGNEPEITRFLADAMFRDQLGKDGVPLWRRWIAWAAVRLFGAKHYQGAV